MVTGGTCAGCGRVRGLGELVVVVDRRTAATWYVCRHGIGAYCMKAAGPRTGTAIALADPRAARERDREQAAVEREERRHDEAGGTHTDDLYPVKPSASISLR